MIFSFTDIVRMSLGVLLLAWLVSYVFEIEYKINDKYLLLEFYKFKLFGNESTLYTQEELSNYSNGSAIYLAINRTVYDVSRRADLYGEGGKYNFLSGKDCSRIFATSCLNQCSPDVSGLRPDELRRFSGWVEYFGYKYWKVGELLVDDEAFADFDECVTWG